MKNPPANKTIEDFFLDADVHEHARERSGGLLTAIVAAVTLLAEIAIGYWTLRGQLSAAFGLGLHAIVVVLLALYSLALMKKGSENRFALLLFMTTATTGPYGAAGSLMAILLYFLFVRRSQSFEEWYESIFPTVHLTEPQRVYDDLRTGRDESDRSYSVIPFLDVLSFGNELQKRHALAKMTSQFHPHFAPAFKKALADSSNTIRVQAATAITKIENAFTGRLMKLTALKSRYPKEPIVVLALAEHYDNYAYTGLLDADREESNRKKALAGYHEYLELNPQNENVRMRIGRLLMREKSYEKAVDWFRQCIALGYQSEAIAQWHAEALFECGKYDELRRFCANNPALVHEKISPNPVALHEAFDMWSGSGAMS